MLNVFLIWGKLLTSGEKIQVKAERKGCFMWFLYFLDLLYARYNCAKFHYCRILVGYVWQILGKEAFALIHEQSQSGLSWRRLKVSSIFCNSCSSERLIFNFSWYGLTDDKTNVLCKRLNFSAKPGLTEHSEFLLPLELLFRNIKQDNSCNADMSLIKSRRLDLYQLTLYQTTGKRNNWIKSQRNLNSKSR